MKFRDYYLWTYIWLCRTVATVMGISVAWFVLTGQMAWAGTYNSSAIQGLPDSNRIITSLTNTQIYIQSDQQNFYVQIPANAKFTVNDPSSCRRVYDPSIPSSDGTLGMYAWTCWWSLTGETGWYLWGSGHATVVAIIEPDICREKVPINEVPDYLVFDIHDPACTRGCH